MKQVLILALTLAILSAKISIENQGSEIQISNQNEGPYGLSDDLQFIPVYPHPQNIKSFVLYSSNIKALSLQSNDLELLKFTQQLSNLEEIRIFISYNKDLENLKGLQYAFRGLDKLKSIRLELDSNNINSIEGLDKVFYGLKSLKEIHINLRYNQIEDLSPLQNAFKNLDVLEEFVVVVENNHIADYTVLNQLQLPESLQNYFITTELCFGLYDYKTEILTYNKKGDCTIQERQTNDQIKKIRDFLGQFI